jgi:hypothetical protein
MANRAHPPRNRSKDDPFPHHSRCANEWTNGQPFDGQQQPTTSVWAKAVTVAQCRRPLTPEAARQQELGPAADITSFVMVTRAELGVVAEDELVDTFYIANCSSTVLALDEREIYLPPACLQIAEHYTRGVLKASVASTGIRPTAQQLASLDSAPLSYLLIPLKGGAPHLVDGIDEVDDIAEGAAENLAEEEEVEGLLGGRREGRIRRDLQLDLQLGRFRFPTGETSAIELGRWLWNQADLPAFRAMIKFGRSEACTVG